MGVLFIFPSSAGGYGINEYTEQPPLGIAYLSAILESGGFPCDVLDANLPNYDTQRVADIVDKKEPDIVCLSLYAFNFRSGLELADAIKVKRPNTIIIAGGAHPSALGGRVFAQSRSIDAVVVGEGELALLEIAQRYKNAQEPFYGVEGVVYQKEGAVINNKSRARIKDLDTLSFPAFHLLPSLSRYHRRIVVSPAAPILTSRGCPFDCIFCSKSVFGKQVFYRSVENVVAEIDYLVDRFKVRQLDIVDDNFIVNKERAIRIMELLSKKPYQLAINLQSGVSATLVDERLLKLMKEAGVYRIAFGVESGNQGILDSIKKKQSLEDILNATTLARKIGIRTDVFFIIGLPGDTPVSMQNTIDFAKKINPDTVNFHMAVPFPGTELYDLISKEGTLLRNTESGIRSGYNYPEAFYEIGWLKKQVIEQYYSKAYKEFYFRPRQLMWFLLNIKSQQEFAWLCKTGFGVLSSIFRRKLRTERLILPKQQHYKEGWGDEELDLLAKLVYHPIYGMLYRLRYQMVLPLVPDSQRLLEIGCGYGLLLPALSKKAARTYGLDIHTCLGMVDKTVKSEGVLGLALTRADIAHLPYREDSFDTLVCISVLEHLPDIEGAILEMKRILKEKGTLIVGFPIKNKLTRLLFRWIGRDDRKIHLQSHQSIVDALNKHFIQKKIDIFPRLLPQNSRLYLTAVFVKDKP